MNVTREKTEDCQEFLTVELEPAELEEALEKSYRRLVKRKNIPGFRKGKAPRAVLERYVARESMLEDALNALVPEVYRKAIDEEKIEAFAQPQIEIVQTDPVIFKAVVPLRPTVELGDYQKIQVTPDEVTLVGDDEVEAVIEQLRHQHASWEPVERPAEFGDLVVFDLESSIDDEPFINQKEAQFQITQGQSFPAPGFSEQLVGMERGQERKFSLEFPTDYPRSELVGKKASFKVNVAEIKQEKLPELNDEFAQAVAAEFKTQDMLREEIASNLKLRAEEKTKTDFEEQVIKAAVDHTQVEFPPILVDIEIDRLLNRQLQRLQRGGLDEYLSSIGKTEEELRNELRPMATEGVTRSLVLGKIAEAEKIEINDAEIDDEIQNTVKAATENRKELEKLLNAPQSREAIRQSLMTRKTVERLVEIAGGSGQMEKISTGENEG